MQVQPHLEKILQAALAYMSYNPNSLCVTSEEGGDKDIDYEDNEDNEEEEESIEDGNDNKSWKVCSIAIVAMCMGNLTCMQLAVMLKQTVKTSPHPS
jgi:hypothetical protein